MSGCPKNTEWVLYAADELPADRRADLEAHLAACAACRGEWESLRRGLAAMKSLPREPQVRPEAMESLRRRLRVAAAHKAARPTVLAAVRRYGWVAAAAAIVVAAVLWGVRPPADRTPAVRAGDRDVAEEITEIAAAIEFLEGSDLARAAENGFNHSEAPAYDAQEELMRLLERIVTEGA